jgi:hypothetical protein
MEQRFLALRRNAENATNAYDGDETTEALLVAPGSLMMTEEYFDILAVRMLVPGGGPSAVEIYGVDSSAVRSFTAAVSLATAGWVTVKAPSTPMTLDTLVFPAPLSGDIAFRVLEIELVRPLSGVRTATACT